MKMPLLYTVRLHWSGNSPSSIISLDERIRNHEMKRSQEMSAILPMIVVMAWIKDSVQVPASATDKFWEEIANVKVMMASIAGELDTFNTLYLTKLENRIVTMATLLGNIDSNVKNLQERAHVWDTFQLHVAAWNEQINTLDKKVDILSRGQEKIALMDGKVSSLVNLDYKVERLVRKMDEADNKLTIIAKTLDNQRDDPLFGEFATRGILSTLKVIERKVDHIEGKSAEKNCSKRYEPGYNDNIEGGEESVVGKGKLVIKCNTPVIVEELLRDVASKVDVIFDKIGQEEEIEFKPEDEQSDELMEQPKKETLETKLLERLWKRLTSPNKKTARTLETIEKSIRFVENTTTALWEDQTTAMDQLLKCCRKNDQQFTIFASDADILLKKVELMILTTSGNNGDDISKRLEEQKRYLEDTFKNLKYCKHDVKNAKDMNTTKVSTVTENRDEFEVQVTTEASNESEIPTFTESSYRGCEELIGADSLSGVYKFDDLDLIQSNGDSAMRYCEIGKDGEWWTVVQRRGEYPQPRQNFTRSWEEYKKGFGNLEKEFWFGNEFIHRLTTVNGKNVILRVEIDDFDGNSAWAEYTTFRLDGEEDKYRIHVGGYTGNATDSLSAHDGVPFSTVDRNNDAAPSCCPCAPAYGGGWWFYSCFEANLNGDYYDQTQDRDFFRGLIWEHWLGNLSLRSTRMMMRTYEVNTNDENKNSRNSSTTAAVSNVKPVDVPDDP